MSRSGVYLCWLACACSAPEPDAAARGEAFFESGEPACARCHDAYPADARSYKPGAALAGVTRRPRYWGGQELDLLDAVNACREWFTNDSLLARDEPSSRDLYAFLVDLEPGDPRESPFSVVEVIEDLPRGDAASGRATFASACAPCHGELHSGAGRARASAPVLPEDALYSHSQYDASSRRLVFIEKIRHGSFFGYRGKMPPFSREALSDAEVSDLLEALGVSGE